MTTVDLTVLVTGYAGFVPVTSGVVTVEYVAGARPAVAVDGDQVRFSTPLRWAIEGVPLSIELEPTGATSCAKITVKDRTHERQLVRWVEIPATGTVAFGDLVDVDRKSFVPADPTPTLLETIDRQVEAYMAEHPGSDFTATIDPANSDVLLLTFPSHQTDPDDDLILVLPIGA